MLVTGRALPDGALASGVIGERYFHVHVNRGLARQQRKVDKARKKLLKQLGLQPPSKANISYMV